MRVCRGCGGSMAGRARNASYCSRECQVRSYRRRGPTRPGVSLVKLDVRIPRSTSDTIDRLADDAGLSRSDWVLRAIGDAILDQTEVMS